MKKTTLVAVIISVIFAFFYVGCGSANDKPQELLGQWVHESVATLGKPDEMEFFKNGKGTLDANNIFWKAENERLFVWSSEEPKFACKYKVSDYELHIFYDDGDSAIYVKKENLKDFKAKQAAQNDILQAKQTSQRAKYYIEQAKQNKSQIERLLEQHFIFVQGATFTMGCTSEQSRDCENDERPAHSVTISDFFIGKYETTQKLWTLVMSDNPSKFKGDDFPVESVSWNDISVFISVLNEVTEKNYRLPTEAEWEFAARGANKSQKYKYSGGNNLDNTGWFYNNSGGRTRQVGQKKPNELGIYDMSGNVWEWCNDRYGQYSGDAATNPTGADIGDTRVLRGGGWYHVAEFCRVASRSSNTPSFSLSYAGFRLAGDK
ncbi:MAG: formylglycine-generating enzyme family protein [Chitinivibrionia bacterium]|nr:formylglycine-generating enzyme family protein [Chitinivibrionia bacterium]